jgi:hypothetical protein
MSISRSSIFAGCGSLPGGYDGIDDQHAGVVGHRPRILPSITSLLSSVPNREYVL